MITAQDKMTLEEMGELTNRSPHTIQKRSWRKKHKFPANRMGNSIIGYRPLIEKWIIDEANGRN